MSKKTGDKTAAQEEAATDAAPAAEAPPLVINAQYIKDLSFEAPSTPGVFQTMQTEAPDVSININVNAHPVHDRLFEVQLHVRSECTVAKEKAFIIELVYCGLFTLNVDQESLQPTLLIECPRLLFPFARNIVGETVRDAGFPPLMLNPVDFVAMYRNQLEQNSAADTGGAPVN